MIPPVLLFVANLLLQLASALARPERATCPRSWYVEGVPPSGRTRCILAPPGRGENECTVGGYCGPWREPLVALPMRICCDQGTSPRVLDDRRIYCAVTRADAPMRQARAQRVWRRRDLP